MTSSCAVRLLYERPKFRTGVIIIILSKLNSDIMLVALLPR